MKVFRHILTSLARICDSQDSRYGLSAVRLEREPDGRPVAVATNGKSILAVRWDEPDRDGAPDPDEQAMLPAASIRAMLDGCDRQRYIGPVVQVDRAGAEQLALRCQTGCGGSHLGSAETVARIKEQAGKFPRWRPILSASPPAIISICVDPRVLASLLWAMADAAVDPERPAVWLHLADDPTAFIRLSAGNEKLHAAAGIMPRAPLPGEKPDAWIPADADGGGKPDQIIETT